MATKTPRNYASFLRRFVALIIDGIILSLASSPLGHKSFFYLIISAAYFTWMVGNYGATIGKMVMGMKIVKEDGSKVSYSDALLRELASFLSAAIFLLGYISVIWDKNKQGWHDKIAKTIVIKN